jgi:spoIIIJ-associated protein
MQEITVEAKTVAQAIEQGLKQAGLRRDQVEVTVVQEPSGGILGFGAKPAKVILREKRWGAEEKTAEEPTEAENKPAPAPSRESERSRPESAETRPVREPRPPREGGRPYGKGPGSHAMAGEGRTRREMGGPRGARPHREHRDYREHRERREFVAPEPHTPHVPNVPSVQNPQSEEAKTVLQELLKQMQFGEATVLSGWDEAQGRVRAEIVSPEARSLIGRDGAVLEALQFMTTLIVNRRLKTQIAVQVDVEGYWKRLEDRALAQANKGIEEVKRTGHVFRLEPMEAALRRLVHKTLADHPDVETVSEGEGPWRKVTLRPRKK